MSKSTALKPVTLDHPINHPVSITTERITPEMAEQWLGVNHGNRNQRPMKVDMYARDMRSGNWLFTGETIKFDWNGRLIDGQHRLEAIIDAETTVSSIVVRGLDPEVQQVLDTNARRSAADALGFRGLEHRNVLVAAAARIALAREKGLLTHSRDSVEPQYSNSEILDWYETHPDINQASAIASRVYRKINATPGVLAYIIHELIKADSMGALTFIDDLENMRTTGEGDPRFALLRALQRQVDERVRRSNAAQISLFFRAWNAHREGRKLRTLPLDASNAPRGVEIPKLVSA